MQKISSLHLCFSVQVNHQQLMVDKRVKVTYLQLRFIFHQKASLDLPRWRSPKEQDTKDVRRAQRHSDVGTPSGYKTFSREGSADFPLKDRSDQDSDSTEKAELVKYAEALVNSRGTTPNVHRKSASAS
ncbi:hypothetical protein ACFXTO_047394 [Malus domestica]